MPPRNDYDMLLMQQNAERRVREMRSRARTVAMQDELPPSAPPNRNWSSATGRGRQLPSQPLRPAGQQQAPPSNRGFAPQEEPAQSTQDSNAPPQHEHSGNDRRRESRPSDGTIIGDVMSALGLEEDTLLIIGLLLILINQKADTTLLLALAYLLI